MITGGLWIVPARALPGLAPPGNVERIGGSLYVFKNDRLFDLHGQEGLTQVGQISLFNIALLENLTGPVVNG